MAGDPESWPSRVQRTLEPKGSADPAHESWGSDGGDRQERAKRPGTASDLTGSTGQGQNSDIGPTQGTGRVVPAGDPRLKPRGQHDGGHPLAPSHPGGDEPTVAPEGSRGFSFSPGHT